MFEHLEQEIAKAVLLTRLMESMLYDDGPWTFVWGSIEAPVERAVCSHAVHAIAHFPAYNGEPPESVVEVRRRGEPVYYLQVEDPGTRGFTVNWTLRPEVITAAA